MRPRSMLVRAGGSAVLLFVAFLCSAQAQTVQYTGSLQYATGNYFFVERTNSVYLSNGLNLSTDRVNLSASVPVIFQSTPWVSYSMMGGIPSGGPQQGAVRRRGGGMGNGGHGGGSGGNRRSELALPDTANYDQIGLGDPSARVDVEVIRVENTGSRISLIGSAKAPLADVDRGFGTGAWDAGLGGGLSQRLGRWFLFGEAVYWWMGDMDDLSLQNAVSYAASVGRAFRQGQIGVLVSLSGYTSEIVDGVDPPLQAGAGVNYTFSDGGYSLNASASFGLSDSSSDVSFGIGWQIEL